MKDTALQTINKIAPDALIYAIACLTAIWIAYALYPASFIDGIYLPNSHDSFYHARRILDAAQGNLNHFSFDPMIHVPEGSWLTWPWAYDYLLAKLTSFLSTFFNDTSYMAILVRIPPAWILVNAAILLWITRILKLSLVARSTALLCFSISPLTQELHGFAVIDHHYVEYTFVLLALALGLSWARNYENTKYAALLGIALGIAPAFHNSLFILQLPIIFSILLSWITVGRRLNYLASSIFALSLVIATTLALIPSAQFLDYQFHFYVHSWFHFYVAVCTAITIVLIASIKYTRMNLFYVTSFAVLLATPLVVEIFHGMKFLSGEMLQPYKLYETQSIATILKQGQWEQLIERYSVMLWVMPIIALWSAWKGIATDRETERYFYVFTLFGLTIMLSQLRMQYFGSFAIYLPLLYASGKKYSESSKAKNLIVAAILIAAHIPGIPSLFYKRPIGLSYDYELTRPIYRALSDACREQPGIVLADHNDGHYVRYHTDCSVISNNMIMTKQHVDKVAFTKYLFSLPLNEIRDTAPYISYIFIRREDNLFDNGEGSEKTTSSHLSEELLLTNPHEDLEMLLQINININNQSETLARLYRLP